MPVVLVVEGPLLPRSGTRNPSAGSPVAQVVWKPADWPVDGLLVHAAGQGANGFRVVDVWESDEAARRFGEKLLPVLQEIGITEQPDVYPAHTFVSA